MKLPDHRLSLRPDSIQILALVLDANLSSYVSMVRCYTTPYDIEGFVGFGRGALESAFISKVLDTKILDQFRGYVWSI